MGCWPYWLPRTSAAPNSFEWSGLWLLTAPNMAGKSSLLRGTLAAALLANVGLFAPLEEGR
jgi:DNA mismatch repair ATPase MutS